MRPMMVKLVQVNLVIDERKRKDAATRHDRERRRAPFQVRTASRPQRRYGSNVLQELPVYAQWHSTG